MLYAIFCYDSESEVFGWSKERDAEVMVSLDAVQDRLRVAGRLGPVARLGPTTKAKTIRKGKDAMVLDGPFAETKEQLLGFYVIECETPEAALEVARELAGASGSAGAFEVRPVSVFRPGALA
jgi:hypothetical protein